MIDGFVFVSNEDNVIDVYKHIQKCTMSRVDEQRGIGFGATKTKRDQR